MAADVPDTTHGDGLDHDVIADVLRGQHADLTARLEGLEADLESMVAASADSNVDDEHDPEGQTIAYERAQLSALILAVRDQLANTAAAVTRLEQGAYGICEVCREPIPTGRLEARPTARTCVEHATTR
ncbi:MAG: TraR/DksA family transcriptional regulator [Actinomycetales bacterium]